MKSIDAYLENLKMELPQITAKLFSEKLKSNQMQTIVLDCREDSETALGTIPKALLLPRGQIELKIENLISDKSTDIVVYCASGTRSLLAAKTLKSLGYQNVSSLAGGIKSWKDEGLSIEAQAQVDIQFARYQTQLALPGFSKDTQVKLKLSKVLIVGAGGLGSPVAMYLAAAGVGTIGIIDDDKVDISNLQRQILHSTDRIGLAKVDSAFWTLRNLNPEVTVNTYRERLTIDNVDRIFVDYDLIIDGCDNFQTRYLVNDACLKHSKTNIHGAVFQFHGQCTVLCTDEGPCYRCLFEAPPEGDLAPNCAEGGVIGALTGVIGSLEALEAIKVLTQIGEPLIGRLQVFDGLTGKFDELEIRKNPDCPACSIAKNKIHYQTIDETCNIKG